MEFPHFYNITKEEESSSRNLYYVGFDGLILVKDFQDFSRQL